MNPKHPFKWRHFQSDIILLCVRWYLRYPLSYRNHRRPETTELRRVKYLNNIVEQDHRFIKRLVNPGMGFGSFNTARRTLRGYEAMNMIRKGQVQGAEKGDVRAQVEYARSNFRSCCLSVS